MSLHKLPLCLTLLLPFVCQGQNWQTVRSGDTSYFTAGEHFLYRDAVAYPGSGSTLTDSPILRMAYVVARSESGGDSILGFFTTLRDTSHSCVDTAGPSWLGTSIIRKRTGTEYYFNSYADTITIETQASLGDSWLIAKDYSGRQLMGSVSQVGVTSIDGSPDSFKTVSLQAYVGSNPVSHPYNGFELQFSKSHGWLKTLDFYRFPNSVSNNDRRGIVVDHNEHLRLPAAFSKERMTQRIDWKYVPGNEWIWKLEERLSFNPDRTPQHVTFRHDSVLAFQLLTQGIGLATIRSVTFKASHVYIFGPGNQYSNSFEVTDSVHTDTVRDIPANPIPTKVENDWKHSSHYRYFAFPFDSVRYFIKHARLAHFETRPVFIDSCMQFPTVSAIVEQNRFEVYLPDFGQTGAYRLESTTQGGSIAVAEYGRYIYIKAGGTIYGTKVNVATLGIAPDSPTLHFEVAPNPAANYVLISSASYRQPVRATLRNIAGQIIREITFSGRTIMSTSDIQPGLYFLELSNREVRQVIKLVIRH